MSDTENLPIMAQLRGLVHASLQRLAAVCDYANQDDHQGFSASHAVRGHALAEKTKLCDLEVIEGARIALHYHRQLGEIVEQIKGLLLVVEEDGRVFLAPMPPKKDDPEGEDIEVVEVEEKPPSPPSTPPTLTLTPEQEQAVTLISDWMADPDIGEFKLGGYAGTGKTTVIRHILDTLRRDYCIRISAFTGKAVNVLQKKKIPACTLHSLMYNVDVDPKTGAVSFSKKTRLEDQPDLIIVDEASMISTELFNDLKSFGPKLLFVGDPGQLEPVGDNPNLMLMPNFVLTKIHRQAEKSPIIRLATAVRNGGNIDYGDDADGGLFVRSKSLKASEAVSMDQIICAKNLTRTGMNEKLRQYKGYMSQGLLVPGEKLIVLRNNRDRAVFNGMILFVEEILGEYQDHWLINAVDETDAHYGRLPIWKLPFQDPKVRERKDIFIPRDRHGLQYVLADYGYVITCHKSQGSEWDKVLVYDEWMPPRVWDMKRWRYTAITRAAKQLTYLL